jgi:hypothetical protein
MIRSKPVSFRNADAAASHRSRRLAVRSKAPLTAVSDSKRLLECVCAGSGGERPIEPIGTQAPLYIAGTCDDFKRGCIYNEKNSVGLDCAGNMDRLARAVRYVKVRSNHPAVVQSLGLIKHVWRLRFKLLVDHAALLIRVLFA